MKAPGLVLTANATSGAGGQGLNLRHMIEALEGAYDLTVFSRGPCRHRSVTVPAAWLSNAILRVPLLRRRRDWVGLASDLQFDRYVARHLPAARVFQGVVGQCAESLRAARRRGMNTVLDVVNTHVDDFAEHVARESRKFGLPSFIHPQMRSRIHREYQTADVIRVMSERAKRTFLARGFPEAKLVTATPPMDIASSPIARFEGDRFRLSFVGLLDPWKGFHYLLEAFDRLKLPGAELVLWGGPGSRAASRLIATYQARNPGILVRPISVQGNFAEVYGSTSVLVHPSLADGFSYAVVEAMSCGVPVIVTDNTGSADLVVEGMNGYVVPVADVDALAERIAYLYRNRHLLPQLGARAREAASRLTPHAFRAPLLSRIGALT